MQAGSSFRKDFPIPQVYIDRINNPEVSQGCSIPQPATPLWPMAPCQPCGPCPSYGLHQHCKSGNRRFLVKKRIPRAFLNFWGLSVNMDNPKGPRGVFSNCGDDFLSRRLILVLRVQYGLSLRPLGHPEGPQGAFSSCWAQYLSRRLILLL